MTSAIVQSCRTSSSLGQPGRAMRWTSGVTGARTRAYCGEIGYGSEAEHRIGELRFDTQPEGQVRVATPGILADPDPLAMANPSVP
jgi:hypothetical protein